MKKYDSDVEYRLGKMIEFGLLEPMPDFVERKGFKLKIIRPPWTMRKPEIFETWRTKHQASLPDWVKKVETCDIFYFKLWDLANLLEIMDLTQELPNFMARYDEGRLKLKG